MQLLLTKVSKSCMNKQLSDLWGCRVTTEMNSYSPFLPICSESIFKQRCWYKSNSKLALSESQYHQMMICLFLLSLFQIQFSATKQTKQMAVSCDCHKSHSKFFFPFQSCRNLTSFNFLSTKGNWKTAHKTETWMYPKSFPEQSVCGKGSRTTTGSDQLVYQPPSVAGTQCI